MKSTTLTGIKEKKVILIKKDLEKGLKNVEISSKYSISLKMVSDIKTGRTWKHVKVKKWKAKNTKKNV